MESFIQNNTIWIIPLINVVLHILIKISAKNSQIPLTVIDFLDFGFGLIITSATIVLTNIYNSLGAWLLVLYFMITIALGNVVNRLCWNKSTNKINIWGIILPDILGIVLMIVSIIYTGGAPK